jgi:hypothetical protein
MINFPGNLPETTQHAYGNAHAEKVDDGDVCFGPLICQSYCFPFVKFLLKGGVLYFIERRLSSIWHDQISWNKGRC